MVVNKTIKLESKEYYKTHFSIVSAIIDTDLSQKEIEVLASFLSLDENIIKDDLINPLSRKEVMKDLNLQPAGLTNHIRSMVKKFIILQNKITKRYTLNPNLEVNKENQGYRILLKNAGTK